MTIRIYDNRIEFDNYTLNITAKGLSVNVKNSFAFATFTSASQDFTNPVLGNDNGFVSGGWTGASSFVMDRHPFRDYNVCTQVGTLTAIAAGRALVAGHSSATHGYCTGGYTAPGATYNHNQKFPFAEPNYNIVTISLWGGPSVTNGGYGHSGQQSNTSGYLSGGVLIPSIGPPGTVLGTTRIEKYPFATDVPSATIPGTLTQGRYYATGHSSATHGYSAGGINPVLSVGTSRIDKFPFATDATVTVVGSLSRNVALTAGMSSTNYGYLAGGGWPGAPGGSFSLVERFSFITDTNGVGIGNLNANPRYGGAGYQSQTSGYIAGGQDNSTYYNSITRFPFVSGINDSLCWTVGGLTQARSYAAGHQN